MNQAVHGHNTLTIYSEDWLLKRLCHHGILVNTLQTPLDRQEGVAEAIAKIGPEIIAGRRRDGKTMSYAEAYEGVYRIKWQQGFAKNKETK